MNRIALAALLVVSSLVAVGQDTEEQDRMFYVDVSAGYTIAMPPFTSKGNSVFTLKPHNGSSISFSVVRKIGDDWGVQLEVHSASFRVKDGEFLDNFEGTRPADFSIRGYNSTFLGVGALKMFPIGASRFTLDVKGSAGFYLTDFPKQQYSTTEPLFKSSSSYDYVISAKRSFLPGILAGTRLRYPLGGAVDVGIKVEYGFSAASFDVTKSKYLNDSDAPEVTDVEKSKKMISFLSTGITFGLKF